MIIQNNNNNDKRRKGQNIFVLKPRRRRLRHRRRRTRTRKKTNNVVDDDDDDDVNDNLFVRLTSSQIEYLECDIIQKTAAQQHQHHHATDSNSSSSNCCWNYFVHGSGGGGDNNNNFLPLEISFFLSKEEQEEGDNNIDIITNNTVYASYNGGKLILGKNNDEAAEDIIEIPESYFPQLSSTSSYAGGGVVNDDDDDNDDYSSSSRVVVASVRALPYIKHCTRVEMEPKTIEDWELIESYSTYFEDGGLLKQVSVVYSQQQLSLLLPTSSNSVVEVQLIVGNISTTTKETTSTTIWPEDDNYDDDDDDDAGVKGDSGSHHCYGLLVQDTEVVIKPKPRCSFSSQNKTEDDDFWSIPLQIIPCLDDWSEDMYYVAQKLISSSDYDTVSTINNGSPQQRQYYSYYQQLMTTTTNLLLPGCIVVHPSLFELLGWSQKLQSRSKTSSNKRKQKNRSTLLLAKICKTNNDQQTKKKTCWVRVLSSPTIPTINHTALHPCIRFELGLSLYTDSVQIQPCVEEEPEFISLHENDIMFQPIHIVDRRAGETADHQKKKPWRIPDINPINHQKIGSSSENLLQTRRQSIDDDDDHHSTLLAVGSLISSSPSSLLSHQLQTIDAVKSKKMFRLILRSDRFVNIGKLIDKQSVKLVYKKLDEIINNGDAPKSNLAVATELEETIQVTEDRLNCLVSTPIVSSIEWAKDLLLLLEEEEGAMADTCGHLALCGPTGSGKTHASLLLGVIARTVQQHKSIIYMDCARLQDSSVRLSDILDELCDLFKEAFQVKFAVIILDDLDRLIPDLLGGDESDAASRVQGTNPIAVDQSKAITDLIYQHIDALSKKNALDSGIDERITIISTCTSIESLNRGLRESIKTKWVDVPAFSKCEREELIRQMLNGAAGAGGIKWDDIDLPEISESFRPRDLVKVVSRVRQKLSVSRGTVLPLDALNDVLADYVPMSNLTLSEWKKTTGPDWDGIGGLTYVKSRLESMLLHPSRYHGIYSRACVRLPRGLMLFGPPGCGKSVLVPALAKLCGFPLLACKGPEVLDKYIGASEAKVRELFERAMSVAPSILFLDELDALAPRRGSDHTGVTDRVVNQLLTYLDGVEDATKRTVYVIGASSRPDKIDPALLRPGRLEEHLFIGPPDNNDDWTDLLKKVSQGWNLSSSCLDFLSSIPENDELSDLTRSGRFTAADFRACLDTAHVAAVHRALSTSSAETLKEVVISTEDLQSAIQSSKPCLGVDDARMLSRVYQPFMRKHGSDFDRPADASSGIGLKTTLR